MEAQPAATNFTTEQQQYLEWVAMPKKLRIPKTVSAYAKQAGVDRTTLWRWSCLSGFRERANAMSKDYLKDEVGEILGSLAREAIKGDVPAIKLALEVAGVYIPKSDMTSGGLPFTTPTVFLPAVESDD